MDERDERWLDYWKKRLKAEQTINQAGRRDITITVQTLEWFLEMIEKERAI